MTGKVKIEVSQEVRKKIMKAFGVSNQTVVNALNYSGGARSQSDMAKRIRRMAMENGGRRMAYYPECETIHDENGIMRQVFDNGSTIEVDKHTGDARWFDNGGKLRGEQRDITVRQLYVMQETAAGL